MAKIGILLINLGSPKDSSTAAVRKYLREFLMDARVIDINPIGRFFLVNGVIAPFRSPKSAKAYQKIWTEQGSPLVSSGLGLQVELQKRLGPEFVVRTAMRYGQPSIKSQITFLLDAGIDELRVLPLYPHYATASVASSIEEVMRSLLSEYAFPPLRIYPDFFAASDLCGGPLSKTFKGRRSSRNCD